MSMTIRTTARARPPGAARKPRKAAPGQPADLAHMCHELKNPLGAVLLFAQMMTADDRCPLSEAQRQRIESIEQAGQQVLEVVSDVLQRAREIGALCGGRPRLDN